MQVRDPCGVEAMDTTGSAVTSRAVENLWVRLKVGDRIRPRDALLLRRLGLRPFADSAVYETDARGYVVGIGAPGLTSPVDPVAVIDAFEQRFGIPQSCHGNGVRREGDER